MVLNCTWTIRFGDVILEILNAEAISEHFTEIWIKSFVFALSQSTGTNMFLCMVTYGLSNSCMYECPCYLIVSSISVMPIIIVSKNNTLLLVTNSKYNKSTIFFS